MLLKSKDETFEAFKRFKVYAKNRTGRKLLCLRDDKGGEYMSKAFERFCEEYGIARQHTVCNRPQQNRVAEQFNCTFEEGIIAMLYEVKLSALFWSEALCILVHVFNSTLR